MVVLRLLATELGDDAHAEDDDGSRSCRHIGEPSAASSSSLAISRAARDIARREKDVDIVLEASAIKIDADGETVVSSRQNHDIEEEETGVDLAPKLPQIVPIVNYARGRRRQRHLYSTALNRPRGTTFFDSTLSPGFHQRAPRYQLTNLSPPRK